MPAHVDRTDVLGSLGDSVLARFSLWWLNVSIAAAYQRVGVFNGASAPAVSSMPRVPSFVNFSVEGYTIQNGIDALAGPSVAGYRPRVTKLITNLGVNDMAGTPKATWLARCLTFVATAKTTFGITEADILWVSILNRLAPATAAEWNDDNRTQLEAIGVNFVDVQVPYMARLGAGGSDPAPDGIHPVDDIMAGPIEPFDVPGKRVYATWALAGVTYG